MRQAKIPNRYDTLRLLDTFYCSIIKREDEKRVTEQAWDNPKFVEDSVGDLANTLKNEPRIVWVELQFASSQWHFVEPSTSLIRILT